MCFTTQTNQIQKIINYLSVVEEVSQIFYITPDPTTITHRKLKIVRHLGAINQKVVRNMKKTNAFIPITWTDCVDSYRYISNYFWMLETPPDDTALSDFLKFVYNS